MKSLTQHITEKLVLNNDTKFRKFNYRPTTKDELSEIVKRLIEERGNEAYLNDIDTSEITDMSHLFKDSTFNGDISGWNVSNVENMKEMFGHSKFNNDISEWNVSKVERMDFSEFDSDEEMNSENKKYHHYIEVAMDYIEENYSSYITLEHVAEEVYLNPVYLSHLFKKVTGVKFSEYLNDFRVKKATELLENSTLRIGEISTKVGYKDSRYFSEMFKKRMGLTPNEYRNKNEK
jgi:YesN/AraC family two-component response regulator